IKSGKSCRVAIGAQHETCALGPQRRDRSGEKGYSADLAQPLVVAAHPAGEPAREKDAKTIAGPHRIPRLPARVACPARYSHMGCGAQAGPLDPIPAPRHGTQFTSGVDPRDRYEAADLHRPLRRDIVNEARLQFGPGYMPKLEGTVYYRRVALQHHEKPRQWA